MRRHRPICPMRRFRAVGRESRLLFLSLSLSLSLSSKRPVFPTCRSVQDGGRIGIEIETDGKMLRLVFFAFAFVVIVEGRRPWRRNETKIVIDGRRWRRLP